MKKIRMIKNESLFQRELQRSLSYNFHGRCFFKKNHGNQFSVIGCSDLDGHIDGKYVAIEAKMWNGRPTTEQLAFSNSVEKSGGCAYFAVYRYDDGHYVYIIPATMPFSYRLSGLWIKCGTKIVPRDPRYPDGEQTEVFDLSNLLVHINSKEMT